MDTIPEKCPTCSTAIPVGATRCPGCGRVFGEDNRCPHCHAIAAVKPRGDGFVCLACGKPRDHLPLTTVIGEDESASRASLVPTANTAATGGLRFVGVLGISAGVLGAALATLALGATPIGFVVAAVIALAGVTVGATALRRATGRDQAQESRERAGIEARLTALAAKHGGDLTAATVAKALRVSPEEADAALTRMADGTRVSLEVDESVGAVHYVFHDVQASLPKTRVAELPEEEGEPEAAAKKARRL